jgi:hypothetical protein
MRVPNVSLRYPLEVCCELEIIKLCRKGLKEALVPTFARAREAVSPHCWMLTVFESLKVLLFLTLYCSCCLIKT